MSDNIMESGAPSIGQQIRTARKERGWSLAKLAKRAGTSAPTLHRYESGWDRFEMATLRKIAAALDARLDVRIVTETCRKRRAGSPGPSRVVRELAPLFWDRDLRTRDLEDYPGWVLERVLRFGDLKQAAVVRDYFEPGVVLEAVRRRGVDARTRNYWELILEGVNRASQGAE